MEAEPQSREAEPDAVQPEPAVAQMPRSEALQAFPMEVERWQPAPPVQQPVDAVARPLAAWEVELVSRPAEPLQPDAAARPLAAQERELERLVSQLPEAEA